MPTYEYECLKCGHRFERFQNINDKPLKTCPKCHKSIRRLIGRGGGIIFKGSGFYATDYRKSKPSGEAKDKENIAKNTCSKTNNPKDSSCSSCPLEQNKRG